MKKLLLVLCIALSLHASQAKKSVVVTYSILGSIVKEIAGDKCDVKVLIPNGIDPHEWEPSAQEIALLSKADLVIQNGLDFEEGLEKAIALAQKKGVKVWSASSAITPRKASMSKKGEGHHHHEHHHGVYDPHLWTDPVMMKAIVIALDKEFKKQLSLDVSSATKNLVQKLDTLDGQLKQKVALLPQEKRKLITGHESLGYLAQRYGFKTIGAIVPSMTTSAHASASDLARLKQIIQKENVRVVFTEIGTSKRTADVLAKEVNAKLIELNTHALPANGSYITYCENLMNDIVNGLK